MFSLVLVLTCNHSGAILADCEIPASGEDGFTPAEIRAIVLEYEANQPDTWCCFNNSYSHDLPVLDSEIPNDCCGGSMPPLVTCKTRRYFAQSNVTPFASSDQINILNGGVAVYSTIGLDVYFEECWCKPSMGGVDTFHQSCGSPTSSGTGYDFACEDCP